MIKCKPIKNEMNFIFRCESVWKIFWNQKGCCVMQILYVGNYSVFGVSTAMIAHTKDQHLTPTYFPYFLISLL